MHRRQFQRNVVPSEQNILRTFRSLRALPAAAFLAAALCICTVSCGHTDRAYVPDVSGETTPNMATTDVNTLISDSGYTRYRIEAQLWLMFEDAEEPHWNFPLGIYLEQYDNTMTPRASVIADSATYFSRQRIWRLDGRVVMVNTDADSFLTEQVFWDQNRRKIYSDSFIHIVRNDRTIEGYGFISDENMLTYSVNNPTAILPAELGKNKAGSDSSARTDTTARPQPDSVAAAPTRTPHLRTRGLRTANSQNNTI